MRVAAINLYPVKATRGVPVETAQVELAGLRHDRRWAIVDLDGTRLSAREHDSLLAVTATPLEDGGIVLSANGQESLGVPAPIEGPLRTTDISGVPEAVDAGDAAAAWFSERLDTLVRLVWQADPDGRPMSLKHGGTGHESLNLADTGPLHLTSSASLAQLNEWIDGVPVGMQRFRPNVVIDGIEEAFAEDHWREIRIGDVSYRISEHCDRCMVPTIDPDTLVHGKEPIRTLAKYRKWAGKTWFGIRIIPLLSGTLSVGDEVSVSAS